MSKAGYGTPEEVLQTDAAIVIGMLEYEKAMADYEEEFITLNKDSK